MRTFHPAINLRTRQLVWSLHKNGTQVKTNEEPEVQSSAFYATLFADAYIDDVKPFSLPA
jgi:hypothetical protein